MNTSEEPYDVHWPIRHGRFNLHSGPGGTITAVVQDLEELWGHALQNLLEIPVKDLKVRPMENRMKCVWSSNILSIIHNLTEYT